MSDQLHDPLPALRAQMDQMTAHLPMVAQGYHAHYRAMVEAGFTDDQAFQLTVAWMQAMVQAPSEDM